MNRVRAYTVVELIVVMIISSIVISIAYKSFDIISSQQLIYIKNNKKTQEILLLDGALTRDFNNCQYLKTVENGLFCFYKNKSVLYQLEEGFLLRVEGEHIDSFFVNAEEVVYKFIGKEVLSSSNAYINSMEFQVREKEQLMYFNYHKQYGANFLMVSEEHLSY